jgi:hypothetical protein
VAHGKFPFYGNYLCAFFCSFPKERSQEEGAGVDMDDQENKDKRKELFGIMNKMKDKSYNHL